MKKETSSQIPQNKRLYYEKFRWKEKITMKVQITKLTQEEIENLNFSRYFKEYNY